MCVYVCVCVRYCFTQRKKQAVRSTAQGEGRLWRHECLVRYNTICNIFPLKTSFTFNQLRIHLLCMHLLCSIQGKLKRHLNILQSIRFKTELPDTRYIVMYRFEACMECCLSLPLFLPNTHKMKPTLVSVFSGLCQIKWG